MPEAFCELEMCAKRLSELCALCERKNSPASLIGLISSRWCVLFLTEEHRRTEHTKGRKIAAPPPTPPPEGRGVITEIPL